MYAEQPGDDLKFMAELAHRLRQAAGDLTYREVGRDTETDEDEVRRSLEDGDVTVDFLTNFCRAYNISTDWLLEGTGPQRRSE